MKKKDIRLFNPKGGFSIIERRLPHWVQPGTVCFVTWRLGDSLPKQVLNQLHFEIDQILANERLDANNWKSQLAKRSPIERGKVQWKLFSARDKFLDLGAGSCLLGKPKNGNVVLSSLQHFDEDRYFLTDVIVMPNHTHFLCAFADENSMLKQCEDWKRYSARVINKQEKRSGNLWQVDQFDHLVRSEAQFEHLRRYIKENPRKAGLNKDQFIYFSKPLTM